MKGVNFFFLMIAFILGITLFRQFNFETMSFKDPALSVIYLVTFVFSIFILIKDFIKRPKK
ncbi:MAG: hypothetical protein C0512_12935 [Flavobacterium sp.]|nr:hypothetical protein [Flavobacterium sp.]